LWFFNQIFKIFKWVRMQQADSTLENNKGLLAQTLLYVAGACAIAAAAIVVQQGGTAPTIIVAALLGMLAAGIVKYGFTRCHLTMPEALQDALITGALAAAAAPDLKIWQAPVAWHELFTMTSPAAAAACIIYFLIIAYSTSSKGRHVSPVAGSFTLAVPLLFNCLLVLQSPRKPLNLGQTTVQGLLQPTWECRALMVFQEANERVGESLGRFDRRVGLTKLLYQGLPVRLGILIGRPVQIEQPPADLPRRGDGEGRRATRRGY
jgi:hypothetical protein